VHMCYTKQLTHRLPLPNSGVMPVCPLIHAPWPQHLLLHKAQKAQQPGFDQQRYKPTVAA